MNQDYEDPMPARLSDQRPPIEYFAAFLDGELPTDDWARVQDWLANHPEDAALVDAHRNLVRCWRKQRLRSLRKRSGARCSPKLKAES